MALRTKLLPGRYSDEEIDKYVTKPSKKKGLTPSEYVREKLGIPAGTVKRGAPEVHGRYKDWREQHKPKSKNL